MPPKLKDQSVTEITVTGLSGKAANAIARKLTNSQTTSIEISVQDDRYRLFCRKVGNVVPNMTRMANAATGQYPGAVFFIAGGGTIKRIA